MASTLVETKSEKMRRKQKWTVCGQCLLGVGPGLLPEVVKGRACSMQFGSREASQPHRPHSCASVSQSRCHGSPSAGFSSAALLCASGSLSPAPGKQDGACTAQSRVHGPAKATPTMSGASRAQRHCPSHPSLQSFRSTC